MQHKSQYDRPYLTGKGPYAYDFLFGASGVYEIAIEAHGKGVAPSSLILEILLNVYRRKDMKGKEFTECEIEWMRQRTVGETEAELGELYEDTGAGLLTLRLRERQNLLTCQDFCGLCGA